MTTTHRIAAALAAVALTACAHASAPSASTPSYLGGRAAQPGSWNPSAASSSIEATRQQAWNEPQLGGRSAQPGSWITPEATPASAAPSYCYLGGRDAQPFSGPTLIARAQVEQTSAPVCERSGAHGTRL